MSSRAYYNEFCPKAAAWLRELIKEGLIAPGDVDERSITDVLPSDLHGYTQCHFFAGIGGWSYALRLAGVPDEQPVWTGSCPCQPFSTAGKQLGTADERHLWPTFFNLLAKQKPSVVLGEQVASKIAFAWLDGVFADLEGANYICAAADLCAAGVGAPHIRKRLFWFANAHANGHRLQTVPNENGICYETIYGRSSGRFGEMGSTTVWNTTCPSGARPMELGNGVYGEVDLLRGYGNAIVPQVAAEFIQAAFEAIGDHDGRSDVLMDDPAF